MKGPPLLIFLIAAGTWAAGCGPRGPESDPGLQLELHISPTPPMVGRARLLISLLDTLGVPVEGAVVTVRGDMTHAGMVPVFDTAEGDAPGRYSASDFSFPMAGDWTISILAELPDGRKAARTVATRVFRAPEGRRRDEVGDR